MITPCQGVLPPIPLRPVARTSCLIPCPSLLLTAEGGVYYSDQQFVSAGAAADEAPLPSRAQALAKFGEFIRTFQTDQKQLGFPYA